VPARDPNNGSFPIGSRRLTAGFSFFELMASLVITTVITGAAFSVCAYYQTKGLCEGPTESGNV
jgi:hypothetical protein